MRQNRRHRQHQPWSCPSEEEERNATAPDELQAGFSNEPCSCHSTNFMQSDPRCTYLVWELCSSERADDEKQGRQEHNTNSWKKQFQHQTFGQDDHRLPQHSIGESPDFQNTPDNGHLSVLHDLVEPRTAMSSRPPGPFSLSGSANWQLMHPQRRIDGLYSLVTRAPRSPWRAIGGAPRNRLPSPGAGAAAFISTSIGCRLASPASHPGKQAPHIMPP